MVVNGTAALAGTLQLDLLNNYNPLGQSFTFLTAAGGVSGKFTTVNGSAITTNRAAIGTNVNYAPTAVSVAFTQLPFAGFAQTPNQVAVANAAQLSPAITVALNAVPLASQFPAALNSLSPQGYQVWSGIAFADASSLGGRIMRDDRALVGQDDYYFDAGQRRGRTQSDADVGESRYTSSSGLVGSNHALDDSTTVGGYFAFGKTTADLGSVGSQTTIKNKTIGLRSAWARGPLFAEAMLAYGFYRYDATRAVAFPGTAAVATASTRGHQWTTGFTAGQHLTAGSVVVSPFLGLLMNRWSANDFTESGAGAFDATVAGQSARSLRSQLGLDVRLNLGMFQPHARAVWLHEFSDRSRAMNASFGNVNYAVATRRATRDSAEYSAGLDLVFGPSALLYTEFTAQSGGEMKVVSEWRVGVSIRY